MDVSNLDLYGLFEVSPDASVQDIKTAYRKKVLRVHPDKNPDNPEAVKLFHQLSEALKLLTDVSARAAYDRVLKVKMEGEIQSRNLNSERKKLKDDLEAREICRICKQERCTISMRSRNGSPVLPFKTFFD